MFCFSFSFFCYNSRNKNRVFAFEPQYKNNVLLEKNIQINKLENFISVIPNPIYSKNKLDFLFSDEDNLSGSASTTFIEKKNLIIKNAVLEKN